MTHLHLKWDTDTVCYQLHSDFWWSLQQIAFAWIKKWLVIKYINSNVCSPLITLDFQEITYVEKLHALLKRKKKKSYIYSYFYFCPLKTVRGHKTPLVSEAKNSQILCLVFHLPTCSVLMWESIYHLQIMKLKKIFSFLSSLEQCPFSGNMK